MQAFEALEYRARLDGVRALMSDAGLDALLVINEGNLCYLTGYEGFSDYVPQAAVVTLEEDPYLVLREMDVRCAERTCWLPEDRLIGYAESYIGSAELNPWTAIGEFVKGKVAARAGVGVEFSGHMGHELGVTDYAKLVEALGVEELRDGSGLVSKCKRVKSERELAYITEAAAITDRAMLAGIEKIAVGTRQCEVAATILSALASGTEKIPGGPGSLFTGFMSVGKVASAPHLKWTGEAYTADEQTNLEFAAFRHRYGCPIARTAYLGSPPARLREIDEGVREAWQVAFDTIRPGVACSDVARAFADAIQPYGVRKESRIGYSIGIDWPDGGASLAASDHTEIVANMTFHLLTGIYERDYGYTFGESIRVTDDGAQSLSNVPRKLFEIPA